MMLECNLYELLGKHSDANADRAAVIDGGASASYGRIIEDAGRLASWLRHAGVRRGDRVGVHLHKNIEEVIAMFAAWRIDAVMVNINRQWKAAQLDYVLRDCDVKALITDGRAAAALADMDRPPALAHVVAVDPVGDDAGVTAWSDARDDRAIEPAQSIDVDLAALLYTSGSTGKPKGVMLSHRNVMTGAASVARYLHNRPEDRLLSLLPFSFDYGLNQLTTMCLVGGTIVLQKVMMPAEIVKTLAEQQVTGFAAVPPVWIPVVNYLLEAPTELPSLRYITNSGGKIPDNILAALPRAFPGVDIYLMYGLTEAFRSTYLPPHLFAAKRGSMGRAIPNAEVFIINDRGVCGPGEEGELVHRGSLVSMGYWGNPQVTAQKIKPCPQLKHLIGDEPVCYSGDIVRMDEDGCLWFVSRADAMIKSSGFRISPTEVEDAVSESGMVTHVVAFGRPDDLLGEAVEIAVMPQQADLFDEAALMGFLRKTLPPYMVPRRVHLWTQEMPRTGSGKLDRPLIVAACLDPAAADA